MKINGYRIELEEIEEQIRQFLGVREAAVAAVDRRNKDQRLVAWFEAKTAVPSSQLREFLKEALAPLYGAFRVASD